MHHLGLTRSVNRRDHLLLTPDTFVRTPQPNLVAGSAIVHVSPETGAGFTMMTVELGAGGSITWNDHQRFLYVLEGRLLLEAASQQTTSELNAGSFAYVPPASGKRSKVTAQTPARVIVLDKPFESLSQTVENKLAETNIGEPWLLSGREETVPSAALNGDEGLQVRALMPESLAFDFACNTMSYAPGASLSQVEMHYMEHGLLMLEGGGIYRLGDEWYPVQAGDFIWMAPYCPQWFCAVGKQPAKYLIYKNFNRHSSK